MAQGNKGFLSGMRYWRCRRHRTVFRRAPVSWLVGRTVPRSLPAVWLRHVSRRLVDPARCRIWQYHNRDYAALSVGNCADLIDSIKSQGRQEVPAIVRRIPDDPEHAFEVICGARRHWTISWLRAHDYPDLKFLVEPRELTDEEAFRVADLENRSRKDLSDYERATDYARALELYYDGSQQRMADRLEVSKSWLSRYLELARLPTEVLGRVRDATCARHKPRSDPGATVENTEGRCRRPG